MFVWNFHLYDETRLWLMQITEITTVHAIFNIVDLKLYLLISNVVTRKSPLVYIFVHATNSTNGSHLLNANLANTP